MSDTQGNTEQLTADYHAIRFPNRYRFSAGTNRALFALSKEALLGGYMQPNMYFSLLSRAVTSLGYVTPTPIQARTVTVALMGKDICACAATGTGNLYLTVINCYLVTNGDWV